MGKRFRFFLTSAILVACMCGCSSFRSTTHEQLFAARLGLNGSGERVVAVLPFSNRTCRPGVEDIVRKSFYGHFSAKRYHDVELQDTDAAVAALEACYGKPWLTIAPAEVGRFLKADLLVYGEVTQFSRTYLGVYSQVALGVNLRIIEAEGERPLWEATVLKRSHQGDLPLNPLSLFSASVRCGMHLQNDQMQNLADRLCRKLAAHVPEPPEAAGGEALLMLQVASFTQKSNALRLKEDLQQGGYVSGVEPLALAGTSWYRVVAGPFDRAGAEAARQSLQVRYGLQPLILPYSAYN